MAPAEELLWSKAFLGARERNDSADVYHLIEAVDGTLDWRRLLDRFGEHWEVLLGHLVFFSYVYPAAQHYVPEWLMNELVGRLQENRQRKWTGGKICRGPMLDGAGSYNIDISEKGYRDARQEGWQRRAALGNFPPLARQEKEMGSS